MVGAFLCAFGIPYAIYSFCHSKYSNVRYYLLGNFGNVGLRLMRRQFRVWTVALNTLLQPIFLFTGGCGVTVAPRRYYFLNITVDDEVPPIASGLRCCWCSVVWLGVCAPSLPLSEGLVKDFHFFDNTKAELC